jgi:predicted anti-sigma-YlaC factor YlaD
MHRPIEEGLEDYLGGSRSARSLAAFREHLSTCGECREQVELMAKHANLLESLRAPAEVEPAPGFYARVMDRVEAQRRGSFWALFLEPVVARPLMYASMSMLLVLASAVWTTGGTTARDMTVGGTPVAAMAADPMPVADGANPVHARGVVLTHLASYTSTDAELVPVHAD